MVPPKPPNASALAYREPEAETLRRVAYVIDHPPLANNTPAPKLDADPPSPVLAVDADAQDADKWVAVQPAWTPAQRHQAALRDLPAAHVWIYPGTHDMLPRIGKTGHVLYTFLATHTDRRGQCPTTLAELGKALNMSRNTLLDAQGRLAAAGMVEIRSGTYGRPNLYTILPPSAWKAGP